MREANSIFRGLVLLMEPEEGPTFRFKGLIESDLRPIQEFLIRPLSPYLFDSFAYLTGGRFNGICIEGDPLSFVEPPSEEGRKRVNKGLEKWGAVNIFRDLF